MSHPFNNTNENLFRYVVYMPYSPNAGTVPLSVARNADVEALKEKIYAHRDFSRHLRDETLILYKVLPYYILFVISLIFASAITCRCKPQRVMTVLRSGFVGTLGLRKLG